jgi:hypothetical protein
VWRHGYTHPVPRDAREAERLLREHERRGVALLEAVTQEDVAELAKPYVQRWNATYNRSQIPPSRSELASLAAAFAAAQSLLDESTARDIRFALRSFDEK